MKSNDRRKRILELVKSRGEIKIKEISKIFNDEREDRIRRDVRILSDMGLLTSVYGGVKSKDEVSYIGDFYFGKSENCEAKELIAKEALKFINESSTIFLEAGSTVFKLAELLYEEDIKLDIVTISLPVVTLLSKKKNYNIILLGGQLIRENYSFESQLIPELIKYYVINRAFIGMRGFNIEHGFTIPTIDEAIITKTAANLSDEVIVLVDSSKFEKHCLINVATFEDPIFKKKIKTVITDKNINSKYIDRLKKENIDILIK